jgi:hypothetical protein
MMRVSKHSSNPSGINNNFRTTYSPYWLAVQGELLPMKEAELEGFTPVLAKFIRVLEWVPGRRVCAHQPALGSAAQTTL